MARISLRQDRPPTCPHCGLVVSLAVQWNDGQQVEFTRLSPGEHQRKLDARCGVCRGPMTVDVLVIVEEPKVVLP